MATQAKITSVAAIENFRAALVIFLARARAVLDEVSDDVGRTRQWVQTDQRRLWDHQLRIRRRRLEEAQAELFNASTSKIQPASAAQKMAVERARLAANEAEAKIAVLKKWDREIENRTEPLLKQMEQLQTFISTDMTRAVAYLAQVVRTLDAYTATVPPAGSPPPSP